MIKVATICSGIGAPEQALKNLGIDFELKYWCENDKFAQQSYRAIHSEHVDKAVLYPDLNTIPITELPQVDLLIGGTPRQDFSLAGKRNGGEEGRGTRSSLMWNFVDIIRQTRPKIVLWENVTGVLRGKARSAYDKLIAALKELGYAVYAEVLNAKNFGIPQNRERVFVLATLLETEFEFPVGYNCGVALMDVLEDSVDGKYWLTQYQLDKLLY